MVVEVYREPEQQQAAPHAARLARQLAVISEVGGEVIALLDAELIFREVVVRLQEGLSYRLVAVVMVEDETPVVKARSPSLQAGLLWTWPEQTVGRVLAAAEPQPLSTDGSGLCGVVVPLRVQDRVPGALLVEFGQGEQNEATELPFLMTVASLVAMAVENIRLFQMALEQSRYLDQRAARLARMLQASDHLQRVGPYEDSLLVAVARLACESLGFRLAAVSRLEPDGRRLISVLVVAASTEVSPQVRRVQGTREGLMALMRPEFQVSRSYCITGEQAGINSGDLFHLPEVNVGRGPWRPRLALLIPFQERDGRITGALTLDDPLDGLLPSLETVQTAEILANHAAIALENARLFEELQRRLRETNTLFSMGQQMVTTLDQDQVLGAIAQAALTLVASAGNVVIHLLDESVALVPRVVHPPRAGGARPVTLSLGEGIAGLAAQQNRTLYVPDVGVDPRFVGVAAKFASLMVVPVSVGQRVIGTLSVDSPQTDAFSPDDERVLMMLANQAAIALENARLYAEARRVDELAVLNRLTGRLSSSLDRARLLHIAAQEIARTLKSEAVAVVLLSEDEKRSTPHIVYCVGGAATGRDRGEKPLTRELAPRSSEGDLVVQLTEAGIVVRRSWQALLTAHERVLGYVELYNPLTETASADALTLLNSMASAVALALDNARLYEEVRDSATELASSQAQLIQSAKLAATGRLAASIAHELNNPLQAVQSCVFLLSDSVPGDDPNRSYLDTALEELARMARIVERMVDFHRPAREGREPTDANQLLEAVLTLVHKRLQQANIRLITALDARLPRVVVIADHIKQVFLNVILNAIDAMPHGGELRVSSRLTVAPEAVSLSLANMRWVEFDFCDTGSGITPEDLPHVFDPFFTRKPRGTGLGLSISYDIVERHGGSIEVESAPGRGSTFRVRLPLREVAQPGWEVET